MLKDFIKQLTVLAHSQLYWWLSIATGLSFMILALIYQYYLDYPPCVLCIHVRLIISLWVIVSIVGLVSSGSTIMSRVLHIVVILIAGTLVERSYQLLGTERGFIFGDCGFELGLPGWLAIEEWFPSVYRIETSCGYTPELILGITMAEALMFFSVVFLLLGISISLVSFLKRGQSKADKHL